MIEYDVDEDPPILSLDHSPKRSHTFRYKPLKSSSSDKSPPPDKRSKDSVNDREKQSNPRSELSDSRDSSSLLSRSLGPQIRSKSAVGGVHQTPDLSIRRIYAVKSLNDIVFSEEDYDIAAVWCFDFNAHEAECFLEKIDAVLKYVFYPFTMACL